METIIYGFGEPWLVDSWIRIIASGRQFNQGEDTASSHTVRLQQACARNECQPYRRPVHAKDERPS